MVIAHNLGAMNAQRQYNIVSNRKSKTSEKLSSGYNVNRAADDAAALSISEKMRRQIRGLSQGVENTEDGVSLCQVADGALAEVHDMLQRINELSIQAANGTNSYSDRQAIQEEINQLLTEIDRISETTSFNERKLFKAEEIIENTSIKPVLPSAPTISTKDFPINQVTMNAITVNDTNMNYFLSDNITFTVNTDNDGLWLESSDGISFSKMSWDDFGITDTDDTQSQIYTYTDINTGLAISFDLKSGASKNEIKTAIDGTIIKGNISIDLSKASSYVALTNDCQYLTSVTTNINNLTYSDLREMGCNFNGQWSATSPLVYHNYFNDNDISPMNDKNSYLSCKFGNITMGQTLEGTRNGLWSQACAYAIDDPNGYSNYSWVNINDEMLSLGYGNTSSNINLRYYFDFTGINNGKNIATLTSTEKKGFNKFATSVLEELGKQPLTITYLGDAALDCTDVVLTGKFEQDKDSVTPDIPNQDLTNRVNVQNHSGIWIQSGCDSGDGLYLEIDKMNTSILGINGIDVTTELGANDAIEKMDDALEKVSSNRAKIGAQQNRLEHTIANENNIVENTTAAESRIRDADMAELMVQFSKENILAQVGQSMMAQSNQSNQGVLSLLQ